MSNDNDLFKNIRSLTKLKFTLSSKLNSSYKYFNFILLNRF